MKDSNHKGGEALALLIAKHPVLLMDFSPAVEGIASWPPHTRKFCWGPYFIQEFNNVRPFYRGPNPPPIHQCCKHERLGEHFSLAHFLCLNWVSGSGTFIWAVNHVRALWTCKFTQQPSVDRAVSFMHLPVCTKVVGAQLPVIFLLLCQFWINSANDLKSYWRSTCRPRDGPTYTRTSTESLKSLFP